MGPDETIIDNASIKSIERACARSQQRVMARRNTIVLRRAQRERLAVFVARTAIVVGFGVAALVFLILLRIAVS